MKIHDAISSLALSPSLSFPLSLRKVFLYRTTKNEKQTNLKNGQKNVRLKTIKVLAITADFLREVRW